MKLFDVTYQPANDHLKFKNGVCYTAVHSSFHYASFDTLDEALIFCHENSVGEGRYVCMRIEEQLFDAENKSYKVIDIHNPYHLLGIIEDVSAWA